MPEAENTAVRWIMCAADVDTDAVAANIVVRLNVPDTLPVVAMVAAAANTVERALVRDDVATSDP